VEGDVVHLERPWSDTADRVRSYAPGFTTMIQPQKLIPGRVYAGFATDGHGGSSGVTFGFDKNGRMIFPDSFDE
jgi:hypothetical protein